MRGSVEIWYVANLGIFIVLLLSLGERVISTASTEEIITLCMAMTSVRAYAHKNIIEVYKILTLLPLDQQIFGSKFNIQKYSLTKILVF